MKPIPCIPDNAPFSLEQRAWLNGFLAGLFSHTEASGSSSTTESNGHTEVRKPLLILFGSQTGTAEQLAKRMGNEAAQHGFSARVLDMNAFSSVDLAQESQLVIVTSTWGDGDPPDNAVGFWNFLNSESVPSLGHLHFAVLGLGDRNYSDFCGAGKKFDERLAQLGAKRIQVRGECDSDYEAASKAWLESLWPALRKCSELAPGQSTGGPSPANARALGRAEIAESPAAFKLASYDRSHPFPARLLASRRLNADGSAKDTRHVAISLRDSGLAYEVGDALGVMPSNCPTLVAEILQTLGCDGEEAVEDPQAQETSLRHALLHCFQITQISSDFLRVVADRSGDATLNELLKPERNGELNAFLHGREIIDLLLAYPLLKFSPAEFVSNLRKLQPRLYSIASSPKANPDEVHLTVAAVRYESYSRARKGVCSTFLADRANPEVPVPVFIQTAREFRLPHDGGRPIIMIGPGTGIAPFRAFLEERRAVGAQGKNWLFFGDQRAATDFLYRDELETMQREGTLTRLDTAFSRDQSEKVYVQQRMLENAGEIWSWLEEGAHFYVCGDAKRMAKDVDAALREVIQIAGDRTAGQADEYAQKLKLEKRYQRDVY